MFATLIVHELFWSWKFFSQFTTLINHPLPTWFLPICSPWHMYFYLVLTYNSSVISLVSCLLLNQGSKSYLLNQPAHPDISLNKSNSLLKRNSIPSMKKKNVFCCITWHFLCTMISTTVWEYIGCYGIREGQAWIEEVRKNIPKEVTSKLRPEKGVLAF